MPAVGRKKGLGERERGAFLQPARMWPWVRYSTLELAWQVLETTGPAPSFLAPWVRSRLGAALRSLACSTGMPTCEPCFRRAQCPYGTVWEPETPTHLPASYRKQPAPYVFEGWSVDRPVPLEPGHTFRVRLRLFGPARGHIHALVAAAVDGGRFGFGATEQTHVRGELVEARVFADDPAEARIIYVHTGGFRDASRLPWADLEPGEATPAGRLRLHFISPTLLSRDQPLTAFDPVLFTDTLRLRLEGLSLAWENTPVSWNTGRIQEDARAVRVVDSDLQALEFAHPSGRRGSAPLHGAVGTVEVADVPLALQELWRSVEVVNVGRQVTYGMGAVTVEDVA